MTMDREKLRQIANDAISSKARGAELHNLLFSHVFTPEKIIAMLDQIHDLENRIKVLELRPLT